MSRSNITTNVIKFNPADKKQYYDIVDKNTIIYGSSGDHDHGSSKVKLKNFVDYKWEVKDYPGHLIAVHLDGKYIAYAIKVNNKASGVEGMVRVTNAHSGQRTLIKGMNGEVLDLQFANLKNEHILGCIDETTLHIHEIEKISENLICKLVLRIDDPIKNYTPKYDKISWCPFIPPGLEDDKENSEINKLVVWSRGRKFQCFNINMIQKNNKEKLEESELSQGYVKRENNNIMTTWIVISPDGSTLSVGSDDGYIRFYQMYIHEQEPRCLHEWKPHNGKVISSFFFLDNLIRLQEETYWKFALTGAEGNTEFKIWDCSSWSCLQTLSFATFDKKSSFIAELDRTSSYLVLTNRETRCLYVLQIVKHIENKNSVSEGISQSENENNENDSNRFLNKKLNFALIKSIAEFPLSSSVLSFSIVDAAVRKYKCGLNDNYLLDELDDYDEENNAMYCVVVKLFIVQPKSVQECHILYQPTISDSCELKSSFSSESLEGIEDYLTDISGDSLPTKTNQLSSSSLSSCQGKNMNENTDNKFQLIDSAQSLTSPKNKCSSPGIKNTTNSNIKNASSSSSQLNLMIPEQFTASMNIGGDQNEDRNLKDKPSDCVSSEVLSTLLMLASVTGSSNTASKKLQRDQLIDLINNKSIEYQEKRKEVKRRTSKGNSSQQINTDILASGNSSPSREVQEIMSQTIFNDNNNPKENNGFSQHISENLIDIDNVDKVKSASAPDWPKVPDVRKVTKSIHIPSNMISSPSVEINNLTLKINQLIDVIQVQSSEINALKSELYELKNTKTSTAKPSELTSDLGLKLEKQLSRLLEEYLNRYDCELKQKLEAFITTSQNREMLLMNQFVEKLTNVLVIEIQRHIIPVIVEKLDIITKKIHSEVAQKLTTTDSILRENIFQVCKSKSMLDTFGNSVVIGVKNGLQSAYVESMSTTLIPAYEKSSREMFKQLHDTFSLGITEVMKKFDSYLQQLQPVEGAIDEILEKICHLQSQIDQNFVKIRSSNEISSEIKKEIKTIECTMTKNLMEIIQSEIRKSFESQAASLEDSVLSVVRSQAHTPAPMVYDVQDQIKLLLLQGQINKAFHQALIANDLSLVEYTLEKADYKSVFNPCVLEQTVLLSLIQQISADMNNHNDIKQRYLSDAILNLNLTDPITKEHAPKVLRDLYKNCQYFLTNYPKNPLCSNIKMIMMALQGMGYKIF